MTIKRTILQSIKTIATAALVLACSASVMAQDSVEWFTLGNDFGHTRFSPAEEITVDNFEDLEVVWEWDGASMGASSEATFRRSRGGRSADDAAHAAATTGGAASTRRLPATGAFQWASQRRCSHAPARHA